MLGDTYWARRESWKKAENSAEPVFEKVLAVVFVRTIELDVAIAIANVSVVVVLVFVFELEVVVD
jgi:hypothetical protein